MNFLRAQTFIGAPHNDAKAASLFRRLGFGVTHEQ